MSLFGDDSPPAAQSTPRRSKNNSSLFSDDATARPTSSLFADDSQEASDSPWSFPTPKRAARSTLIKTLLPGDQVPELYVDVYDRLAEEEGGSVDAASVRTVLEQSGIGKEDRDTIFGTVVVDPSMEVGRGEVNVLIALIGLAQEGEDFTLDGVDERRKNLPIPDLGSYTAKPPTPSKPESEPEPAQSGAQSLSSQTESRPTTSSNPPRTQAEIRPSRKQSFGFPDTDPWASPDLHKGHNHGGTNGNSVTRAQAATHAPERTTSAFTTRSEPPSAASPAPPTRQSSTGDGGWGSFRGDPEIGGGFAQPPGGSEGNDPDPTGLGAAFSAPRIVPTGADEVITVTSLPEMEGMLFFQHRNYQVTSARRNSKVIRRYSDFVWLLDCLHKRYPFRQLPLLPPKRVAINGNYLAADASFVEKRRRGLTRFANALVRHPVLGQEQLVVMFLTVPTELAVWRKQASISVQDEFIGKNLPAHLEDSLPADLQSLFDRVRTGVRRSAEQYINLCNYVERLAKRNEGMAAESIRISSAFSALTAVTADTYASDAGDMVGLNLGLTSAAKHVAQSQGLLEDEARAWDEGVLEDLKRQRDGLVSVRDMFDRRDRLDRDTIPSLEKRIRNNEEKLVAIRAKPEGTIKPGEAQRVEDAIIKDKQSIVDQHARGIFVKECIRDEIMHFQASQYQISRLQQDWAAERVKYAELQAENWRAFADEVEAMPLGDL